MLRSLQAVGLVSAGAVVVAALALAAITNDVAVDHAGAPLWKSPGEAYRVCSWCSQRHTDLEMPRCMRCKAPFFAEEPSDEPLPVDVVTADSE
jgi:hypothetical protein